MIGELVSVNVGLPREVEDRGRRVRTGIFKAPVAGRVAVGPLGLEGDGQADLESHGGADKAVYLYSLDDTAYWEQELGRAPLPPGQLGENLSVRGLDDDEVHIGDVLCVGSARLEVSQARVPCFKLGIRMESPAFPKRFLRSARTGFYARVLDAGDVGAGDAVGRAAIGPGAVSVRSAFRLLHGLAPDGHATPEAIRRVLEVPALSDAWRGEFEALRDRAAR